MSARLPQASLPETAAVVAEVVAPTIAKGPIIRRPRMVAAAERLGLDSRAVRRMQRLRDAHGEGPVMLRVPGRPRAVVLHPEHVHRVLEETHEPFATASSEKHAALAHFEPKGALISHGADRADRRSYNESVLESDCPMHSLAAQFTAVVEEEASALLRETGGEPLTWERFSERWFRVVRRVVFGDGAAGDTELRDLVDRLRGQGNWAMFYPRRDRLRQRFFDRLRSHLDRAEPGSLAAIMARTLTTERTAPAHQVPQWLFAFDPAGMTTFRSLALLAVYPSQQDRARAEAEAASGPDPLPFLRAIVLESLRLWPTTPLVLRETTRETTWDAGVMPEGTGVLIYAPLFHRDDTRLPFAHRLAPEVWMEDPPAGGWPLIPFSSGPGVCPGRHVVLLVASAMLAALARAGEVRLVGSSPFRVGEPLPGTLDPYSLRFEVGR
jgi:cytochrome P450